jgi:hypothetical protein
MNTKQTGHTRPTRWLGQLALVAAVPVATLVGVGLPAQAVTPPISVTVSPTASLQTKGTAIVFKATVNGPAGQTAELDLIASQRAGTSVLSSQGSRYVTLTGTAKTVFVQVNSFSAPLTTAPAFVTASAFSWDDQANYIYSPRVTKTVTVGTAAFASGTDRASHVTATLGSTGKIRAKGAGATVPVTVTCTNPADSTAGVTIFRKAAQGIVSDSGQSNTVRCTADKRTITVPVNASYSAVPFAKGTAFVRADVGISFVRQDGTTVNQYVSPMGTITLSY